MLLTCGRRAQRAVQRCPLRRCSAMKIKPLSRNEEDFTRERKGDKQKVFKSTDPLIHQFERAREYTRALNAVKWERLFATPFVGALDGHTDGVYAMSTVPNSLVLLLSGAGDGEVRLWNLSTRKCVWRVKAHDGLVRAVTVDTYGERVFSCSSDKTIKCWKLHRESLGDAEKHLQPVATYLGSGAFGAVDHQRKSTLFASASTVVDIWDRARAEPLHSFQWGADSVYSVRFNPVDTHVLCSTAADRSIVLYDVRQKTPIRKLIMQMSTNAIAWNPMEAFNFTAANEDTNLYTFDMRKLDIASNVHRDHVSAVMSVDYAPTGREFVSGSYDRTVRIWRSGADAADGGHSREVYHTKRMQRIFAVRFSADNKYVLSGSDDTNIRLWKAVASERLRTLLPREQNKRDYLNALKERFKHQKETSRIARHRHLPKQIYNQKKRLRDIVNAKREKLRRVIKHSKPGAVPLPPERKKKIVKQIA